MSDASALDALFRQAVSAIDAGDGRALDHLLAANPRLVRDRLEAPGPWLRDQVGDALDGFFERPYLLWFVAEDPVRHGRLPANIAEVAGAIVRAARQAGAGTLQEQVDHALRLVSWSWIARECDVQLALIDVLVDAGAALDGNPENALVNGNIAAAEHLVARGAPISLATAACLARWDDVARLGPVASAEDRQFALILAALRGQADALAKLIGIGVDLHAPSASLHSHATALHHAVYSGSIDAVKVLVDAGAALDRRDAIYDGTPLDWAEHGKRVEIADYLRGQGARRGVVRSVTAGSN
jgi:peptide-methionine (S)-S-oxide reductase